MQNGLDDDEDEEEDTEDDSFGYEGEATEDDLNEVNSDLDLENSESKSATPAELILQRCQIAATQIVCGLNETQSQSRSQQVPSQAKSPSADQPRDCLAPQKVSHTTTMDGRCPFRLNDLHIPYVCSYCLFDLSFCCVLSLVACPRLT